MSDQAAKSKPMGAVPGLGRTSCIIPSACDPFPRFLNPAKIEKKKTPAVQCSHLLSRLTLHSAHQYTPVSGLSNYPDCCRVTISSCGTCPYQNKLCMVGNLAGKST